MRPHLLPALAAASIFLVSGCLSFKSKIEPARYFVLASSLTNAPSPSAPATNLAIGLWPVSIPGYLRNNRLAVRKSTQEVAYQDLLLWSERLEQGLQRVIGHNLAALLGTDQLYLSVWRPDDVKGEVAVEVRRFDVDEQGAVRLEASWRLTGPNGVPVMQSGQTRIEKTGPTVSANPAGAVATMNAAITDLSGEIARAGRTRLSP